MNLERALPVFFEESRELLQEMEGILLETPQGATPAEDLNALFRAIHTIKGSAGLFGMEQIVHFCHRLESTLDQLRAGELTLDADLRSLLLSCHDQVGILLDAATEQTPAPQAPIDALLQQLAALDTSTAKPLTAAPSEPPSSAAADNRWLLSLHFSEELLRDGMEPADFLRYLQSLGSIEHIRCISCALPQGEHFDPQTLYLGYELLLASSCDRQALLDAFAFASEGSRIGVYSAGDAMAAIGDATRDHDEATAQAIEQAWRDFGVFESRQASPAMPADRPPVVKHVASAFIKVDAHKLDSLIDLVGELVIAHAASSLQAQRLSDPALLESTQHTSTLIEQIRANTLSMRMVQIGDVFQRFERAAHDLSIELNKTIRLHISGADTELDRAMVDKLSDPLTHLLRNAIDHGIEPSAERARQGKSPEGHIWLNAYHDAGCVVIEVSDDGAGLDPDKLKAKAIERGLLLPEAQPSLAEIHALIFAPGFSTAAQVTDISGRGAGMDVVQKNIQRLRGAIEIDSLPGDGTTFRIRLPLTLAIIDGLLVEAGLATFVLPIDSVLECLELPPPVPGSAPLRLLELRDELIPLLYLTDYFDLPRTLHRRRNVVVVRFGDNRAGLVVDALRGEFQTVIKPLSSLFRHLKSVSGSTILGDGSVALILDIQSLIRHAIELHGAQLSSLTPRPQQDPANQNAHASADAPEQGSTT